MLDPAEHDLQLNQLSSLGHRAAHYLPMWRDRAAVAEKNAD